MTINYIIVDDEKAAHEIILDYAKNLPFLTWKKSCYNAIEAIEYLNTNNVQLIFLDLNMPKVSGFEFLRTLPNPPSVIVTSAYQEYALEAFELNVKDYLLKPFGLPRFISAVNKVIGLPNSDQSSDRTESDASGQSIFIKDNKKHYQIKIDSIKYLQAFGNYAKVHLADGQTIIASQTLSMMGNNLPDSLFMRVHKSYTVAIKKIDLIDGNTISIGDERIPIGKNYREFVKRLIK